MKILQNLFTSRKKIDHENHENIMDITRAISPLIANTTCQIFNDHRSDLIDNDQEYITYAVWGASPKGPLTDQQIRIHNQINPSVMAMFEMLGLEHLKEKQKMAIFFIIRYLLSSQILFMIELFKNGRNDQPSHKDTIAPRLQNMDVAGHA